jgi:hypothetical protein
MESHISPWRNLGNYLEVCLAIYIGTRTDYLARIPVTQVQDVKNQLLERFNDRCALASTTLGSLSDIEDDLKGECRDIFSVI